MNTRVLASNQEQACADCCSALAEALPHFLQELHVGFTLCGASGLAALLPRLTALPSLSVLRCEGNALGLEGMQLLANFPEFENQRITWDAFKKDVEAREIAKYASSIQVIVPTGNGLMKLSPFSRKK